ncbi:MAG: hypothetical protein N4A74_20575 [Carboxylicivirga sp.]|jgi:endonuclease G|nr:hypothetical protein [Carboxylicivirga sp.]
MKNQKTLLVLTIVSTMVFGTFLASKPVNQEKLIPEVKGQLVEHLHYCLDYNEDHEQANWVYYEVTPDYMYGNAVRRNKFKPGPLN